MSVVICPHLDEALVLAADQSMAREIASHLARHYPGHRWAVHVDSKAGMAYVENWALSTHDGYRIRLDDLDTHDAIKRRAVTAGGEFLERFSIARGRANDDEVRELARTAWKR